MTEQMNAHRTVSTEEDLQGRVQAVVQELLYRYWRLEGGAGGDCGYRSGKADGIDTAVCLLREMAGVSTEGLDVPAQRRAGAHVSANDPAWLPDSVDDHVSCVVLNAMRDEG